MANVTIKQFADVVGVSVDRLLSQLGEAGLPTKSPTDLINEVEKNQLLSHLRQEHGKDAGAEPSRVTLKRKTVSELQLPVERTRTRFRAAPAKTVAVEFRKKRTYVKRSVVQEEEAQRLAAEQEKRDLEAAIERDKEEAERRRLEAEQEEKRKQEEAKAREEEEAKARAEAAKQEKLKAET